VSGALPSLPLTMINKRLCVQCDRTFTPSSGHRHCPSCRSRDLCVCGQPKQVKSERCSDCHTEVGDANGNWRGGRTR
jgi:hypothetical protein